MARISYDEPTAASYKAVREVPRDGLTEWREAVRRHLAPTAATTLLDVGAGTGAFSIAFREWFDIAVVAVEPSAAMRAQIPRELGIEVLEGDASSVPRPDSSVDGAWLSLMIHHVPDLDAAARELRRVVRPGAPVLIRGGMMSDRVDERIENIRWFPETARVVATYVSVEDTCAAFTAAGFRLDALESVRETNPGTLADYLAQVDTLRQADTTMRTLTDEDFRAGKERLRDAVARAESAREQPPRENWLDLLVLR